VRFDGGSDFQEIPNVPKGYVPPSDETCTVNGQIDKAYLSNYGQNFNIAVAP
jgi:hypothetical protein